MVLIYDFLIGKGVRCGGKYKKIIHSRKSQLKSALTMIKVKRKVSSDKELVKQEIQDAVKLPKYLRINTLLTSKDEALEYFKRSGFTLVTSSINNQRNLKKKEFMEDMDIPNLLVFHPDVDLHDDRLYQAGEIIFQDKASCMPAMILLPTPGSTVIDACAAPGNKTSHVAAIMSNRGKIYAFDVNARRLSTMDTLLLKAGVLCCQTKVQDFLKVSPGAKEYKDVRYILLDPSCSGSGIVSRLSSLTDDGKISESRLQSLAEFQLSALKHALSFPNVERVCYSTCSIHQIENEDVVRRALRENHDYVLENLLPEWKCRGISSDGFEEEAKKCIRCSPESSLTNGFFVALFKRR